MAIFVGNVLVGHGGNVAVQQADGVGVRDDGACRLIIAVRIAAAQSGTGLYVNGMAVAHDLSYRCGNGGNTVLIGLDLF